MLPAGSAVCLLADIVSVRGLNNFEKKQIKQEFNFKFKLIHVNLFNSRDYWLLLYIGYCEVCHGFMGLFDNSVTVIPTKYECYLDA